MPYLAPLDTDCNHLGHDRPEIGADANAGVELPPGLDPVRHSIIAEHWFGWRPGSAVAAQVIEDLAFRHKVKRLVARGDRVVGEMLAEIAADRNLGTVIDEALDRYIEIDDAALDAIGGRDFPPRPLHEVVGQ